MGCLNGKTSGVNIPALTIVNLVRLVLDKRFRAGSTLLVAMDVETVLEIEKGDGCHWQLM